jgi:hypothetical protein
MTKLAKKLQQDQKSRNGQTVLRIIHLQKTMEM